MRSGDDHSKERCSQRTIAPANDPYRIVVSVAKIGRFGNYLSAKKGVLGAKLKSFRYSATQEFSVLYRCGTVRHGTVLDQIIQTGSNPKLDRTLNWIELPLINGISEMNLQLNDNYLYKARGHSTTNSKRRFAGVASTALDEVSDFRIFNLGTAVP
jgi:hypothetical protein